MNDVIPMVRDCVIDCYSGKHRDFADDFSSGHKELAILEKGLAGKEKVKLCYGKCVSLKKRRSQQMDDEYMRAATWVVCPWCDEKKCVGRFNCDDIARWIEGKKKEETQDES